MKYLCLLALIAGCALAPAGARKVQVNETPGVYLEKPSVPYNDTLDEMARLIGGCTQPSGIFANITNSPDYACHALDFTYRWQLFESQCITKVRAFQNNELSKHLGAPDLLFYPFSGPDILYPVLFFPSTKKFILFGLEPVGTLPAFELMHNDALIRYLTQLDMSLHAILNYSFFRTKSMADDLGNTPVNGTIHLLLLFLNRTGHHIISVRPVTVDNQGIKVMKTTATPGPWGMEIIFGTPDGQVKELNYFSVNADDKHLQQNRGFVAFLEKMPAHHVYIKSASYLMHGPGFSMMREHILKRSDAVVQDDSGLPLRCFTSKPGGWTFIPYGEYTGPINLFRKYFQNDLDSLYQRGASPTGFGIGYNYADGNSNLLVITRK